MLPEQSRAESAHSTGPPLILASSSPRRQVLLARTGLSFTIRPANVDETPPPALSPRDVALVLARRKAHRVAGDHPRAVVLGVDTVVEYAGQLLGKPRDAAHATAMLRLLQGQRHAVHTAMDVIYRLTGYEQTQVITAWVTMRSLSDLEIELYVATGEPLDKAGAYGLQDRGGALVAHVEGSRLAVVGLPLDELLPMLAGAGITVPAHSPGWHSFCSNTGA